VSGARDTCRPFPTGGRGSPGKPNWLFAFIRLGMQVNYNTPEGINFFPLAKEVRAIKPMADSSFLQSLFTVCYTKTIQCDYLSLLMI